MLQLNMIRQVKAEIFQVRCIDLHLIQLPNAYRETER